jgi:transcriptional regulator with XRE-family HTH domain
MALHSKPNLLENLRDRKFRDSFVSARVDGGTAFQVRYMREKEGWTQEELARRLGTSQNAVWRLESPNYGKASISTLKRIASTFDVALVVRFVRFSELLNYVLNQTTDSVTVDSFDKDYKLWEQEAAAVAHVDQVPAAIQNSALGEMSAGQHRPARLSKIIQEAKTTSALLPSEPIEERSSAYGTQSALSAGS